MITIIYTVGNGYRCGCCRNEHTGYEDFYDETTENIIINYCIDRAKDNDWDFRIDGIKGYDGDEDEFETRIHSAINDAEKKKNKRKKIKKIKGEIGDIDTWFNTLEKQKVQQVASREKLLAQLTELEQL